LSSAHPVTTQIYPLSLHDALPISSRRVGRRSLRRSLLPLGPSLPDTTDRFKESRLVGVISNPLALGLAPEGRGSRRGSFTLARRDRKSTRLNSSHVSISYAVFCLK